MMREDIHVRQIPGERRRRWFVSDDFDLIVWFERDGAFAGFELCYDKAHRQRSLVWRSASDYAHMAVDDGEHRPGKYKAAPVLVADGAFDALRVHAALARERATLPTDIADYVLRALAQYSSGGREG